MVGRKKALSAIAEKDSLVSPSSPMLDHHLEEIIETVEEVHNLALTLKVIAPDDEKRDVYEAELYAALTHLDHHVKPAIKEWDRVVDRMPDD